MNFLLNKIQKEYAFSDFQMKLIRYAVSVIFYDFSKLLCFAIYLHFTGKTMHFLFAAIPLFLLRTRNGGIHFRNYWQCFVFSFIYLFSAINLFPCLFPMPVLAATLVLILCALSNYLIGPNVSTQKRKTNLTFIRKAKWETFFLILAVAVLFFFFPQNEYLAVSLWTIILHTLQLVFVWIQNNQNHNLKGGEHI